MTAAAIIAASAIGSGAEQHQRANDGYRPDRPMRLDPLPLKICEYCKCSTYEQTGECHRCGAPLA